VQPVQFSIDLAISTQLLLSSHLSLHGPPIHTRRAIWRLKLLVADYFRQDTRPSDYKHAAARSHKHKLCLLLVSTELCSSRLAHYIKHHNLATDVRLRMRVKNSVVWLAYMEHRPLLRHWRCCNLWRKSLVPCKMQTYITNDVINGKINPGQALRVPGGWGA
jgi:hypothetical protein